MIKYLLLLPLTVFAGGSHHEPADLTLINTEILTTNGVVTNTLTTKGIALGIAASQHHFDFGTKVWQGSVGTGSFDGNTAFSFGIAKRLDRVLINGSVSTEHGKTGYGAGINWRF